MIYGIGIDIIEVERVKDNLSKLPNFKEELFTSKEIDYCESKHNRGMHYAARFSAKEAFLKAIGTGLRNGIKFTDIEVINDKLGKAELVLYNEAGKFIEANNIKRVHLSLSHTTRYASAVVILETVP